MKALSLVCAVLATLAVLSLAECTSTPTPILPTAEPPSSDFIEAEPWPEADALFRSNPRWLGSDDAYSVDLGNGRTLWLFADTFVSRSFLNTRRLSTMIRNSVGLQSGYDPSSASMEFYWRTRKGTPLSFFPEDNDIWFWPGHGIALEGKLFIFLMATRSTSEGIGFEHIGWRAVSVSNLERPPSEWSLKWLETPENPYGLIVSGSVIQMGDHVLAFCAKEPEHTIHLVRWPIAQMMEEDLTQPQWWAGEKQEWVAQQELTSTPQPLFSEGHTEFTVHYEPKLEQFLEIQTVGFGGADLGFRMADSATGTWSPVDQFYRPEEHQIPGILIYAGKAHPQLMGSDLVLTYATNIAGYGRLVDRDDLYYPRFLKATFKDAPDGGAP
jgi:hypothetical protein